MAHQCYDVPQGLCQLVDWFGMQRGRSPKICGSMHACSASAHAAMLLRKGMCWGELLRGAGLGATPIRTDDGSPLLRCPHAPQQHPSHAMECSLKPDCSCGLLAPPAVCLLPLSANVFLPSAVRGPAVAAVFPLHRALLLPYTWERRVCCLSQHAPDPLPLVCQACIAMGAGEHGPGGAQQGMVGPPSMRGVCLFSTYRP